MAEVPFSELVTPAELTGYARAALADRPENQLILSRWLPDVPSEDIVYRFTRGGGGLVDAASFRAWDTEPLFGRREGIARVTGELPPIGEQAVLGEYDQLRLRADRDALLRPLLLRDAARIARAIDNRLEIARRDALFNGVMTIAERGIFQTVNFGRLSTMSVVPAIAWSDTVNATAFDDLVTWSLAYATENGQPPAVWLTDAVSLRYFMRNTQVRQQLYPNNAAQRLNMDDVNALLEQNGLPRPIVHPGLIRRNGVAQPVVPAGSILMLPERTDANPGRPEAYELGGTFWGRTLEADRPEYGIEPAEAAGLVVAAQQTTKTPIRLFTIGAAIGLPVVANPNLAMKAQVA